MLSAPPHEENTDPTFTDTTSPDDTHNAPKIKTPSEPAHTPHPTPKANLTNLTPQIEAPHSTTERPTRETTKPRTSPPPKALVIEEDDE